MLNGLQGDSLWIAHTWDKFNRLLGDLIWITHRWSKLNWLQGDSICTTYIWSKLNGLQGIQYGLCTSGASIMDSLDHCGVHIHYINTQDFIWILWKNTLYIYDLNWTLHGRLGKNWTISDELKTNLDHV